MSLFRISLVVVGVNVLFGAGHLILGAQLRSTEQAQQVATGPTRPPGVNAGERSSEQMRTLQRAVSSLALQMDQLEGQLRALRTANPPAAPASGPVAMPTGPVASPGTASGHGLDELGGSPDAEAYAQRDRDRWESFLIDLDESFEYEAVDEGWASEVSADIALAISDDSLGGLDVTGVDCRETLCRIEISSDGDEPNPGIDYLLPQRLAGVLADAAIDRVQAEDGTMSTVIYLTRDGYGLPATEGVY